MTPRPVQAVFFWPADMATPFRAVYGRIEGSTLYSKDFHQIAADPARAMERAFGIEQRGQTDITWVWPGGQRAGNSQFKPGSDSDSRSRAHWPYGESPDPWRLTPHPTDQTVEVITGTPGTPGAPAMPRAQEAIAEAQLQKIQTDGERPWYVAVHLLGDGPVLHVRTFLENPQPAHEYASWENLPQRVRWAMADLRKSGEATGFVEFEEGPAVTNKLVQEILAAFSESPNVLLVGPPGTGKTVALEELEKLYHPGSVSGGATFDPAVLHGAFGVQTLADAGDPEYRSLVFHPSYAYEHFVMGLLPTIDKQSKQVIVEPHVGPLLELGHFASQPKHRALLVLDEFNRGAAAAIFGDTLALLDGDKRSDPDKPGSGAKIATPYHHLNPKVGSDALGPETSLPSTLKVVAAMNSADRSVAPLDAALRRRFAIIHVEPDYEVLADKLQIGTPDLADDPSQWTHEHVKSLAVEILKAMNGRIESILGRDFLLGPSVFWHVKGNDREAVLRALASAMDNKVMGTLSLTFIDSDDQLAGVLKVSENPASPQAGRWSEPDGSIQRLATRRLRPVKFSELDSDTLIATLKSLL